MNIGIRIYYAKRLVFFNDIEEMPVYYWNKYRDTLKGKYLVKYTKPTNKLKTFLNALYLGITKPSKYNRDFYADAWNDLYQQYIDKFGFEDSFMELLRLKKEKVDIMLEFMDRHIDERDRFLITRYKLLKKQIEELEKDKEPNKKYDFEAVKVYVDKWIGAPLDDRKCSVVQYQYYINEMQKPNKQSSVNGTN